MAESGEAAATVRCAACGFRECAVLGVLPGLRRSARRAASGSRDVGVREPARIRGVRCLRPAFRGRARGLPVPGRARAIAARRGPRVLEVVGITLRTVLFAALVAGVIQALRPPRAFPRPAKPFGPEIVANARALAQQTAQLGGPFDAPWASIDSYLAGVLPPTSSFARAAIVPRAGGFLLIVERRIFGLPVWLSAEYRIVTRGNGIGLDASAAAVGRLPLPVGAAEFIPALSGGIDHALFTELDVLRAAKSIQITQEKIRFNFPVPPAP